MSKILFVCVLFIWHKKIVRDTARAKLFYFIFSAVSELTFLRDDKRVGIGERKLAVYLSVCNEFSV